MHMAAQEPAVSPGHHVILIPAWQYAKWGISTHQLREWGSGLRKGLGSLNTLRNIHK
jgi:hypothetical protein